MAIENTAHRKLRSGFTTGTAAAAAAKAAVICLLEKRCPEAVRVNLLNGETWRIPVRETKIKTRVEAECQVVKDAGDDPDVTNGALVGARVFLLEKYDGDVEIAGGEGVGTVTKPGLEVEPGQPAINPGPRRMIEESVRQVLERNGKNHAVRVEIFVPEGRKLARKTLNFRLGIEGGISILGTTGVVRPMSHEAYTAAILSSFSVARAMGVEEAVLSTGRRSERCARKLFVGMAPEGFVQIGDFFGQSIKMGLEAGFRKVFFAAFFGKAIKMAFGAECTHAAKTRLSLRSLADWAVECGSSRAFAHRVENANTAREAFGFIQTDFPDLIGIVGDRLIDSARGFAENRLHIGAVIFDYQEKLVWKGEKG